MNLLYKSGFAIKNMKFEFESKMNFVNEYFRFPH